MGNRSIPSRFSTFCFWRDAWNGEGTSNTIPHIFNDNYAPNTQVSTWWLQNGSYLRMKNIQIGYTLPKTWLSKIHFQNVRVYFSGDNLLTFTDFSKDLILNVQHRTLEVLFILKLKLYHSV